MCLIYDALRVAGYYAKLAPPELLSCSEMSASAGRSRVSVLPLGGQRRQPPRCSPLKLRMRQGHVMDAHS